MHPHFLIQLLTGFTLSALCFQQGLAETTKTLSVAGRRPMSIFVTAVRQAASQPTLSSINPARTGSTTLPSLQPADEKAHGKIQEVAGGNDTAVLLSNRSVPNPLRHPICKRYLNVSLSPSTPIPLSFCNSNFGL